MTGGAFTECARSFLARVAPPIVEKPFEVDMLVAAIDALMIRRE
jgi:hypothetical protein